MGAFIIAFFIYSQLVGNILDVDGKTRAKILKTIPKLVQRYDLDKPNYVKLLMFCKKLFTNKLEYYSLDIRDKPVYIMPMILEMVKTNLALIFSVIVLGSVISILLGMISSRNKNPKAVDLIIYLGMSIPAFILAKVIFLKFFNSKFMYNYINTHSQIQIQSFDTNFREYVLPFIALSVTYISQCTKRIKAIMPDIRKKEFITTAYAYGFSRKAIEYKYLLKNALNPIITFIGNSFSAMFSELIVVQTALDSNGLGGFFLSMVHERQYDAVFACVVFMIAIIAIFNYLVDILYFVIDPRIKVR